MGERFVMNFQRNGETILNTYQHWNGYTRGALETLIDSLTAIKETNSSQNLPKLAATICEVFNGEPLGFFAAIRKAINPAEYVGSGLYWKDLENEEIKANFHLPESSDRNSGIIGVLPETIKDLADWGEETAYIDLDTLTARIPNMFWEVTNEDIEERKEFGEETRSIKLPDNLPSISTESFNVDQLRILLNFLNETVDPDYPDFIDREGNIFRVVE